MTDANFQLKKFIGFLGDESNVTESSDVNVFKSNNTFLFPQNKDYDNLKNLLRNGEKEMAKSCIENGCCLNKDRDYSFDGSPLHLAVSLEYSDIVELLLEKGALIDSVNDSDETPLMLAAMVGNSQIIDMLLSKASSHYRCNDKGFSHFHIACMQNNIDIVRKFLDFDTDINKHVSKKSLFWPGFTPLHFAVEFKCIETAKFLIENGADITKQDKRGLTPLHLAFRKRNRVLIDIILSVQYYFASNPVDSEGLSHFHIACAMNKKDVVEDFLAKKINIKKNFLMFNDHYSAFNFAIKNQCIDVVKYLLQCNHLTNDKRDTRIIDYAYKVRNEEILKLVITSVEQDMATTQGSPPSTVNSPHGGETKHCTDSSKSFVDEFGHIKRFKISEYSELHLAVLQKNKEQINSILEIHHPSIITVKDAQGKTPLHLAFEMKQKDLVIQLLSLHFEIDENPVDSNNLSHFHISCTTRNVSIVEDFIKNGVDINMSINMNSAVWDGCTPLHFAIMYSGIDIVKLLLDNGADFTFESATGLSPYNLAIPFHPSGNNVLNSGNWEFVEIILLANECRKIDGFKDQGITLLHTASVKNDVDMIKYYATADTINKKIDDDVTQWAGYTALHLAAYYELEDAVKTLLNCGADPTIEDYSNRTAARLIDKFIDDRLFLIPENVYDYQGCSTFHWACRIGNKRVVQHFLEIGVDVNERIPHNCMSASNNCIGRTPLHLAVLNGDPEIVELLLGYGASVNARDCYFYTPLHFCDNTIVLKILLDYGADPGALNCLFYTALDHTLYFCNEPDFTTAVIESGWDINTREVLLTDKLDLPNSTILAEHILRLLALGISPNEKIRDFYASIIKKYRTINTNRLKFTEKCDKELDSMKGIQIDSRTRLYDILVKSSSEMVVYCRNETFRRIVESEQDLRQKYPIYAYLVNLQFKKGLKRTNLVQEGKKSLNVLTNRWMGDLIFETILQFINDYELTYLNYAASVIESDGWDINTREGLRAYLFKLSCFRSKHILIGISEMTIYPTSTD